MTRKFMRSGVFLLLFAAAASCKKSGEAAPDNLKATPAEHGALQGVPVTKTIGPSGGTIQSPEGNIAVEIPAGAVPEAVSFSIQPVAQTLSSATGTVYRLLPENVQFQKDVKITMKYTDENLAGTSENDLYMAYQDAEGFWHRVIMTGIDKTNRTLSVHTRHFSDWAIERTFYIKLERPEIRLETNEETSFIVYWGNVEEGKDVIIDGGPVPDKNIDGWFINGPGSVNHPKSCAVIYKAPASIVKKQTIAVGVRVKNMVDKRHPERPGTEGIAIVQVPVTLLPDEYFIWTVDGTEHVALAMDAALLGNTTTIMGTGLTGGIGIFLNGAKAGNFETGSAVEPDRFNIQLSLSHSTTVVYLSQYYVCGEPGPRYGNGKLTISYYGHIGEAMYGYFAALVYTREDDCQNKSKRVSGYFKIRRKA